MKFMNAHSLLISTLSPIHIGCGHDYEPTNYVIDEGKLYAFEPSLLMAKLDQRARDELKKIVDQDNSSLPVQRFFFRQAESIKEIATHSAPVAPTLAAFYAQRVGQVANRQGNNQNVINKLEIARTAFDPLSALPMLPGSSIKGAIRTAILESIRISTNQRFLLTDDEAKKTRESARKAKAMELSLLGGSFNTDPLRLLKVSDAMFRADPYMVRNPAGEEQTRQRLAREIQFQVNRKKKPNQFVAGGNVETLVECVPALQPSAFACQVVVDNKAELGDKTPNMQVDMSMITNACNSFYIDRFGKDLAMLEANNYVSPDWVTKARKRLEPTGIWGKHIAANTGFLLRLGRHSGAESVTIDAPRKIKIMKGNGAPPDTHARSEVKSVLAMSRQSSSA